MGTSITHLLFKWCQVMLGLSLDRHCRVSVSRSRIHQPNRGKLERREENYYHQRMEMSGKEGSPYRSHEHYPIHPFSLSSVCYVCFFFFFLIFSHLDRRKKIRERPKVQGLFSGSGNQSSLESIMVNNFLFISKGMMLLSRRSLPCTSVGIIRFGNGK